MEFTVYNKSPSNVFTLYGTDENSATFALGFVLAKSPAFAKALLHSLKLGYDGSVLNIELQKRGEFAGFTDIEIKDDDGFHLIIEAKKDWQIPSEAQLQKYACRFEPKTRNLLLSLSAASAEYARGHLPRDCRGVKVDHRSWADVQKIAASLARQAGGQQKVWLKQLDKHLKEYVSMQEPRDNRVYVIALSKKRIRPDTEFSWVDVVVQDGCYFHPRGKSWPQTPPNYIGFRWDGCLQSVHHIDAYEVVDNPVHKNPKWSDDPQKYFVYKLGPPIKPQQRIASGPIWNRHVKCAIDTLLSGEFKTIKEAGDETKRRLMEENARGQ